MKTIQLRRSRPTALALALALLITMLFVYVAVMPSLSGIENSDEAAAELPITARIPMEGMEVYFRCDVRAADALQARILAARCVEEGGAGMLLEDGTGWAVVYGVGGSDDENTLLRSATGLALELSGSAAELAAVTDAVNFLRTQAGETGSLAAALENGETDASSIRALLRVYQTQGRRVLEGLEELPGEEISILLEAVSQSVGCIDQAIALTEPSSLRMLHASACERWVGLLEALRSGG